MLLPRTSGAARETATSAEMIGSVAAEI